MNLLYSYVIKLDEGNISNIIILYYYHFYYYIRMNTTGYKKPVLSNRPSIQGVWHERLSLNDLKFTITTVSAK